MERTPKLGRPARLSREKIVEAALELGIDALTMQSLADHLGVSKSALYGWVSSREDVLGMVSDLLVTRAVDAARPDGPWQERLATLAHAVRREFLAVPGFAARIASPGHRHGHDSEMAYQRFRQYVVTLFEEAGVEPPYAVQSWYIFSTSLIGWLAAEQADPTLSFDLFLDALLRGLPARGR